MHFLLTLIFSSLTWAHQTSLNPSGNELIWKNSSVPMVIRTNTPDLSASSVINIIQNSMAQWNMSSSAKINSVSASSNEIKFVSSFPYGNAVIGVTELSYNNTGGIQKAVIMLNDNYLFKGIAGTYNSGEVFLGDVVTHELGHVFGLSHSEVLDASMFYSSFSGQSSVAFDDQSGIRQKYDTNFGKISGIIKGGDRIGVLGAHVQAISRKTGKASAVVSDENGNFELGGLNLDDTYYIYTSPVKNPASLPGYFSNVQNKFCPAAYVGSFFSKCGHENEGKPQGISLTTSNSEVNIGTITINCGLKANSEYNLQKLQTSFGPLTVFTFDPNVDKFEQAYVGWFQNQSNSLSKSDVFKLDFRSISNPSQFVKFSLVSFPFGTQLEYSVEISNPVKTASYSTLVRSEVTNTYSADFEIFLPISGTSSNNLFEVKIKATKISNAYIPKMFPSSEVFSSGTFLPYMIVASLWEDQSGVKVPLLSSSEANLSDNESCLDAPYTYAVSKTKETTDNFATTTNQAAAAAGCGTIEPPKSGPGSSLGLMTLGFMLTLLSSSLLKTRKKFLS